MNTASMLALAALATAGLTAPTEAALVPNPGTPTVDTFSTTASVSYIDTPVTKRIDDYITTISATLDDKSVFSVRFDLPFSDAAVQQAVASADAILASGNASYSSPALTNSSTSLQSSVVTLSTAPTLTCAQLTSGAYATTGNYSTTVTTTFGPATIAVGDCQSDMFVALPGQLDVNTNNGSEYAVPIDLVTTDTYLTAQSYLIAGTTTPAPSSVPEPSSAALLLGCSALFSVRRWRGS